MKKFFWVACLSMVCLLSVANAKEAKIGQLRALRAGNEARVNKDRKLLLGMSNWFGNPFKFAHKDYKHEEAIHNRNMMMYMDIANKQEQIKKLLDLVNLFPERMDDFSETINNQITQISMATNFEHQGLLKDKI